MPKNLEGTEKKIFESKSLYRHPLAGIFWPQGVDRHFDYRIIRQMIRFDRGFELSKI
jgi:hypothetical protein